MLPRVTFYKHMIIIRVTMTTIHTLCDIVISFFYQVFLSNIIAGFKQVISIATIFFKILR